MDCLDSTTPTSPTGRRTNKPMVERRRRERINRSLEELKALILNSLNKDVSEYSKMEKADILEMTVNHIRSTMVNFNNGQQGRSHVPEVSTAIYQAGFRECASEVVRYLALHGSHDSHVKARLTHHLSGCVSRTDITQRMVQSEAPTPLSSGQSSEHLTETTRLASLPGTTVYKCDSSRSQFNQGESSFTSKESRRNSSFTSKDSEFIYSSYAAKDSYEGRADENGPVPRSGLLTPPSSPFREKSPISPPISNAQILMTSHSNSTPLYHPVPIASKPSRAFQTYSLKRLQYRPAHAVPASGCDARSMWRPW